MGGSSNPAGARASRETDPEHVRGPGTAPRVVCPHLRSLEGPWRVPHASRDHRCALLPRETRLETAHQRTYCLTSAHRRCPINVQSPDHATRRLVGTSPVLVQQGLAPGTAAIGAAAGKGLRAARAGIAVLVVVAAIAVFLLARGPLAPGGGAGSPSGSLLAAASGGSPGSGASSGANASSAGSGDSPTPAATASRAPASHTPSPRPTRSPKPTATPGASGSASPGPGQSSDTGHTYVVQTGDTLWAIAQRFKTTVAILRDLNGLTGSTIRPRQVLKLP